MKSIGTAMGFWKRTIAALGAAAGLALAPAQAQADVCGDFDDIAEDLLGIYFDQYGDFFTLSEKTCDSMTKTFQSACDSAVKDAEKCWNRQVASLTKASSPACKEAAKNPSACTDDFKSEQDDAKNEIGSAANFAYDDCAEAADIFWDVCRFGF